MNKNVANDHKIAYFLVFRIDSFSVTGRIHRTFRDGNNETKCKTLNAGIAQLVEHDLAKVGVASSNLVSRSKKTVFVEKQH